MQVVRSRFLTAIIAGTLLFSVNTSIASAETTPDEQWTTTLPADVLTTPYVGFLANGIGAAPQSGDSYLLGQEADGTQVGTSNVTANHWCTGYKDPACANSKYFKYSATLGLCTSAITVDCVSAIEAVDSSGKKLTVTNVKAFSGTQYRPFEGDLSVALPTGGAAQIVDIPGAPHAGGTQYLIDVHNDGAMVAGKESFLSTNLNAQIFAVRMGPAPAGVDKIFSTTDVTNGQKLGKMPAGGDLPDSNCVDYSVELKECALAYPMPLNVTFKVTFKVSGYVMGWFHGRVSNAAAGFTLEANPLDKNKKIATISLAGNPVTVPTYLAWGKKSELAASINTFNAALEQPLQGLFFGSVNQPNGSSKAGQAPSTAKEGGVSAADAMSVLQSPKEYNQNSIDQLNLWMSIYGDKAATNPTRWIFQSIDVSGGSVDPGQIASQQNGSGGGGTQGSPPPQGGGTQGGTNDKWTTCYRKNGGQLSGVVSTNATQYIAGPPTFEEASQSLDYKVAAPHYLSNGSVFQGTYNLQVSETLAKCIYGFTDAPISATVSVISSDGAAKVMTTLVSTSGGFVRLSVAGFTFSSPTIRVKLSQKSTDASKSTTTPTKTPSATSNSNSANGANTGTKATSAKSIICLKGKLTKTVTGKSPKCPSGYSLKK